MSNHKANSESFLLQVRFHEHGTLQGTVTWADENRAANFRSGMELLQLLDEAMASGNTAASDWIVPAEKTTRKKP